MNKCVNCSNEFEGNFCTECGTKVADNGEIVKSVFENSKTEQGQNSIIRRIIKWALLIAEIIVLLMSIIIFIALYSGLDSLINPITVVLPLLLLVAFNIGLIILCKCAFDWDNNNLDKRKLIISVTIISVVMILITIVKAINMQLA